MLKWLFCSHEYKVIDKYYLLREVEDTLVVDAYKVIECAKCDSLWDEQTLHFEEIDKSIQSVKDCINKLQVKGYKDEVSYRI